MLRELGIADDPRQPNANGGAIALGHLLGTSGARIGGVAALELCQMAARYALATMCVSVGRGIALPLENIDGRCPARIDLVAPLVRFLTPTQRRQFAEVPSQP